MSAAERKRSKEARAAANRAAWDAAPENAANKKARPTKTGQAPAVPQKSRVVAVHYEGVRFVLWLVPLLLFLTACNNDQVYVAAPTAAPHECPATEWTTSSASGSVAMLPVCLEEGRWGVVLSSSMSAEGGDTEISVWPGTERAGTFLWTGTPPLTMTAGLVAILEVCEGCPVRPGWSRVGLVADESATWDLAVRPLP